MGRPVTDGAWDGSASRWNSAVSYCASCLIDTNQGTKSKTNCSLPIREPDGTINRNACHAAAAALAGARGASIPDDEKKAAARKLIQIYRQDLNEDPTDDLIALAGNGK